MVVVVDVVVVEVVVGTVVVVVVVGTVVVVDVVVVVTGAQLTSSVHWQLAFDESPSIPIPMSSSGVPVHVFTQSLPAET